MRFGNRFGKCLTLKLAILKSPLTSTDEVGDVPGKFPTRECVQLRICGVRFCLGRGVVTFACQCGFRRYRSVLVGVLGGPFIGWQRAFRSVARFATSVKLPVRGAGYAP